MSASGECAVCCSGFVMKFYVRWAQLEKLTFLRPRHEFCHVVHFTIAAYGECLDFACSDCRQSVHWHSTLNGCNLWWVQAVNVRFAALDLSWNSASDELNLKNWLFSHHFTDFVLFTIAAYGECHAVACSWVWCAQMRSFYYRGLWRSVSDGVHACLLSANTLLSPIWPFITFDAAQNFTVLPRSWKSIYMRGEKLWWVDKATGASAHWAKNLSGLVLKWSKPAILPRLWWWTMLVCLWRAMMAVVGHVFFKAFNTLQWWHCCLSAL